MELEHGTRDPQTNVTGDDVIMTAKIARAHLNEFPDYYTPPCEDGSRGGGGGGRDRSGRVSRPQIHLLPVRGALHRMRSRLQQPGQASPSAGSSMPALTSQLAAR